MERMRLTPADDMKDELWGKVGTPERDKMERQLRDDVTAYCVGEAMREARIRQKLTQEQLGERIGVQKAQICRLERGRSMTIPTMSRVFHALGAESATLDLGTCGKVALW